MLFNYFKVALRNLYRKKIFTIINIIGLSVGTVSSLLVFLYVQHEMSFDKFWKDKDRLYRIIEDRYYPDRMAHFSLIPSGFSLVIPGEIPEVEASTRLVGFPNFNATVRYEDNIFSESYFFNADTNFFDVFPFRLIKGNRSEVLHHPNTIVLTASTAAKYFGEAEPIGKSLKIFERNIEVVGVMEDVPENSHLKFDALSPMVGDFAVDTSYYIAGTYTYVRLAEGANPGAVEGKMPSLIEKYAAGEIERELGISFKKYSEAGNGYKYYLQPVGDIHLYSQRLNEIKGNGNSMAVNVLSFVGILIIIIAGINFVNLATARSAERAREVGVRKVLGSKMKQLIAQFLSESLLISAVSVIIALVFLEILLSTFNSLSQTNLHFNLIENPLFLLVIIIVTLILGIAAGLYPAFYISTLKPVQILKGKFQSSSKGRFLRNGLVIFQFTISIILISATLIVYDQLTFMQNKSLGFNKEDLLIINHPTNGERHAAIRSELRKIPGVTALSSSNSLPGGYFFGMIFKVQGEEEAFTPKGTTIEDNFISTMNLKIIEGRAFSPEFDDSLNVIINQKAAAAMRLKDPVGTVLINNANPTTPVAYKIVGVVEDFNFESLHTEIAPLIMMSIEGQVNFQNVIVTRLERDNLNETLKLIEARWKELVPNEPFNYTFMDGKLANLYESENKSGRLLMLFTIVAIVIACVGLFGLAAYTANQRTKEIGIRKVLGASVPGIVALLSKDFIMLVIIAMLIATPLAWLLVEQWLQSFAFRVPIQVITFLTAGIIVFFFTAVTISYQAISASIVNPADSLKEQ